MTKTTREAQYDDIVAPGIDYLRKPEFKVDFWDGQSAQEKAARDRFFHNLLHRPITRGESKDKRLTSLFDTAQWIGPTFDILFAKQVETLNAVIGTGAKVDAVSAALAGVVAKVLTGGEPFDEAKLLASITAATEQGTLNAYAKLAEGLPVTLNVELGRPDTTEETAE